MPPRECAVAADLKKIYLSATVQEAEQELEKFAEGGEARRRRGAAAERRGGGETRRRRDAAAERRGGGETRRRRDAAAERRGGGETRRRRVLMAVRKFTTFAARSCTKPGCPAR